MGFATGELSADWLREGIHSRTKPAASNRCAQSRWVREIFTDQASGASAGRDGLATALSHLRQGNELVVWKLDRLGRMVRQLVQFVEQLHQEGVGFTSVTDLIETSTPAGRFFFHVMAALVEMERDLIRARTNAGLAAARARGRSGGRKPKLSQVQLSHAHRLLEDPRVTVTAVATSLGVSRSTLYRALNVKLLSAPQGASGQRSLSAKASDMSVSSVPA